MPETETIEAGRDLRGRAADRSAADRGAVGRAEPTAGAVSGDAYGCVDWFDYCPVPRTEPPVRRIRS